MQSFGVRALVVAVVVLSLGASACASSASDRGSPSGKVAVAAAEDFWGSIAKQLGGVHAEVRSLVSNPNSDPHDYEPTPADARAVASAKIVITNGIGYDTWIEHLLSANPVTGRSVLKVGDLIGLKAGANPHQWYSPSTVDKVIAAMTEQYKKVDPADAAYFDQQRVNYETAGLSAYKTTIADINAKFAGAAVGASESVLAPLAGALKLNLVTPESFQHAISEGSDPTAADKATVDQQIAARSIRVFVVNSQNRTPDVRRLVDAATRRGIPVVSVTETLTPRGSTFQDWQTRQLDALRAALTAADGG
jgi:zinc/manganese transport system substrate-binding protein